MRLKITKIIPKQKYITRKKEPIINSQINHSQQQNSTFKPKIIPKN